MVNVVNVVNSSFGSHYRERSFTCGLEVEPVGYVDHGTKYFIHSVGLDKIRSKVLW